jgi:hypothetical protein
MPASYTNLYIEQGATFSTSITLDDSTGANYNLQNYSVISQLRTSYYTANATANFSTTIDTGNAIITMSISSANTANIPAGRYVYDTLIKDNVHNTALRILEGIAEVSPSVSR